MQNHWVVAAHSRHAGLSCLVTPRPVACCLLLWSCWDRNSFCPAACLIMLSVLIQCWTQTFELILTASQCWQEILPWDAWPVTVTEAVSCALSGRPRAAVCLHSFTAIQENIEYPDFIFWETHFWGNHCLWDWESFALNFWKPSLVKTRPVERVERVHQRGGVSQGWAGVPWALVEVSTRLSTRLPILSPRPDPSNPRNRWTTRSAACCSNTHWIELTECSWLSASVAWSL